MSHSPSAPNAQTPTTTPSTTEAHAAETLVHVARLVHGANTDAGLTPAQWTALRYFASANTLSRTPSAFSEFHATTRGTASQTVKSLIALGLLSRRTNEQDARSTLIDVTEAGMARLAQDPLGDLIAVIEALPSAQGRVFAETLAQIGAALARKRAAPTFGQCGDCAHCETGQGGAYCHCTQSVLRQADMGALCVDFSPGAPRLR